ncbi:MAG: alpha/beta fold hydrolase [Myxococcales bacterium]
MAALDLPSDHGPVHLVASGPAQAPLVLFAHPFGLDGSAWDELRAACVAAGLRTAALDAPGFGRSPARGEPLTMEALAGLQARAIDALGATRAALVGCSMGGYVQMAFARLYPRKLAAAVLLCTRAGADSPEAQARRESQAQAAVASGPQAVLGPLLPSLLAPGAPEAAPAVLDRLRALTAAATAQGVADALRGMARRRDATADLRDFPSPALVLAGERDQLVPRAEMAALAAGIPGARLEVIPRAGHLAFLEQPGEVAARTLAFLADRLLA